MTSCPWCSREFGSLKQSLGHQPRCSIRQETINKLLNTIPKNELEEKYCVENLSVIQTSKHFKIPRRSVIKLLSKYNIPIRSKSLRNQIRNIKIRNTKNNFTPEHHLAINQLREDTIKRKYGVTNISKLPETIVKIIETKSQIDTNGENGFERGTRLTQETILKKYGVKNVFQLETVKEKTKQTLIQRYGIEHAYQLSSCGLSKSSQDLFWEIYKRLSQKLKDHCYFGELNTEYGKKDSLLNRYYYYDFVITSISFCIEFNGEKFHPNKETLSLEEWDNWKSLFGAQTANEVYTKDNRKKEVLQQKGFEIIVIWWKDYIKNPSEVLTNILDKIDILEDKLIS